jgi:hypothetical protein
VGYTHTHTHTHLREGENLRDIKKNKKYSHILSPYPHNTKKKKNFRPYLYTRTYQHKKENENQQHLLAASPDCLPLLSIPSHTNLPFLTKKENPCIEVPFSFSLPATSSPYRPPNFHL